LEKHLLKLKNPLKFSSNLLYLRMKVMENPKRKSKSRKTWARSQQAKILLNGKLSQSKTGTIDLSISKVIIFYIESGVY
jgi:hypothetical protein